MSIQAVVNTPATAKDALPASSGPDAAAATSEWFKRAGYYAAQAVANAERTHRRTVERRLDKPSRRKQPMEANYVGFRIPDEFVVGYGLDYAERYRNLPDICVLPRQT